MRSQVLFGRFLVQIISAIVLVLVASSAMADSNKPVANTILVFGDSLSAGYNMQPANGWVALLQARINQQKLPYTVVNASVSGETTSGGLTRFNNALNTHKPNIVILELGGNDGLRGLPITEMQSNLNQLLLMPKGTKVLLLGMQIPPNYGLKYAQQFSQQYQQLAQKHRANLVPFFLDGVAGKPDLIQNDGIHPNELAQPILLENVWQKLVNMLKK